jgi:hypothetical protein
VLNSFLKIAKLILMRDLEKLWVIFRKTNASSKSFRFSSSARRNQLMMEAQMHELLGFRIESGELIHESAAAETNFVGDGLLTVLAGDFVDVPCRGWRCADEQAD